MVWSRLSSAGPALYTLQGGAAPSGGRGHRTQPAAPRTAGRGAEDTESTRRPESVISERKEEVFPPSH